MRSLIATACLGLAGCGLSALDQFETCDLDVALDVASASPGTEVVLLGGPQTSPYDTRVEVGGVPAEVVAIERNSACSACETCRFEAECLLCGTCLGAELEEARRIECFGDPFEGTDGVCGDCEEQLAFIVPELPGGPTTVVVLNRNGASAPLSFAIDAGPVPTADTAPTRDTASTTPTITQVPTADTGTPATAATADTAAATGDTSSTAGTASTADTGATADTAPTADTSDTGS